MQTASRFILALVCCVAFAGSAQARSALFRADLSDAENVPPFMSPTDAEGRFLIRKTFRGELRYSLDVSCWTHSGAGTLT